ncbi:MAG: OmpA family protein [Actinomycetia bacterium]|nr:OmpA family protein [Actinomycetes bacterium]
MITRSKGRSVSDVSKYTSGRPSAAPRFGEDAGDDSPMSSVGFVLTFLVGFIILAIASVNFGTATIEADIESRSVRALNAAGYPDVAADAAGTSVVLSGNYTTEQTEDGAFAAVNAVLGVSDVAGTLWPVSTGELAAIEVTGDAFDITWTANAATIAGSVSTADKLAFVEETLNTSFAGGIQTDNLSTVEGLEDESAWLGTSLSLVQRIAAILPEGRVIVDPNSRILTVSGETEDKTVRDELNELTRETAGTLGFDVNPAIRLLDVGPTVEEVEELQVDLDELIEGKVVEFEVKSFDLTDTGKILLDEISAALSLVEEIRVEIAGHTDSRGDDIENQLLSEQRANAVFDYLVVGGADPERFDVIGFGETQPIADNETNAGRARNRRIQFTALLEE